MKHKVFIIVFVNLLLGLASCGPSTINQQEAAAEIKSQDDKCDDPDGGINCCFLDMPSNLMHIMEIPYTETSANKLVISGTIYKADGKTPWPGVILYAYHTNSTGVYPKNGNEKGVHKWHGYLHGWCKTDDAGRYEIRTIRPGRYPNNKIPAHIHAAVKKPDNTEMYINDFVFADDSLINESYRSRLNVQAGGTGIVSVILKDGVWTGKREITLP